MRNRRNAVTAAAVAVASSVLVPAAWAANSPIALTGWNADVVAETTNAVASTTTAFDTVNNEVFYVAGLAGSGGQGLPATGTIASAANAATTFQLQPYTAGNALFFNGGADIGATLTLTTPATFSTLAVLDAAANHASVIAYTLHFSDGTAVAGAFSAADWFNNTPYAIEGVGEASRTNPIGGFNANASPATNPRLYETDVAVPAADQSKVLTAVTFAQAGGNQAAVFAVSGAAGSAPALIWNGNVSGGAWDTAKTVNWKTATSTGVKFASGGPVLFDDSAAGTTTVAVATAGVSPSAVTFDNAAKAYTVTGGPITGGANGLTLNGTGSVTLDDANAYVGPTTVNAGTLTIGGTAGAIASPAGTTAVVVAPGGTFALAGTGQTAALTVTDNGTVKLGGPTQTLASLTGAGTLVASGGRVTVGGGSFAGTITGAAPVTVTGNLTLSGSGTYTGGTTVNAGDTLTVANPTALGTGTVNLNGGTLRLAAAAVVSGFAGDTLNGGPTVANNVLTLTDGGYAETRSAYTTAAVPVYDATGFTAHFVWQATPGSGQLADGVTFAVQNDPRGPTAVGGNGGSIGYEPGNTAAGVVGGAVGITNGAGVVLDTFDNNNTSEPGTGTSDVTGGTLNARMTANGTVTSTDPVAVDLAYANGTLTELLTDQKNGSTATFTYAIDVNALLGGRAGYVGFTGSTGTGDSTQTISDFTFADNVPLPVSVANAVVGLAGTRSVIQIAVIPGHVAAGVGPVTVQAGATVTLSTTTPDGSVLPGLLTTPSLTLAGSAGAWTGTFDLGRNALDVAGGDLATVTDQVRFGLTGAGGIVSSAAAADADRLTTVGVIRNNQGGSPLYTAANPFDGTVPGPSDVLVAYTYFGDANLDGKVDGQDYALVDAGYASQSTATPLTGWYNGDFNDDGKVDASDYTLIDNAFNAQGASLSPSAVILAASTAEVAGGGVATVPEPVSAVVLSVATAGLFGQRGRSRRA